MQTLLPIRPDYWIYSSPYLQGSGPRIRQTTEPEDTQVPCGGPTVTQLFGHHIKYQQQKSFVFFLNYYDSNFQNTME